VQELVAHVHQVFEHKRIVTSHFSFVIHGFEIGTVPGWKTREMSLF
jgi:hypothetical protein